MKTSIKRSRAEAWVDAARKLYLEHERIYNLIVEIDEPGYEDAATKAVERHVDAFLAAHRCQPIQTVADTIFPSTEYISGGLAKVFKYPSEVYPHIKKLPANRWGTYALRMTERKCADGSIINPLELVIDKLKDRLATAEKNAGGPPRAIYELDLNLAPMELKLYDVESDYDNPRGGQCLSHVSLKLGHNKELYLTAVYRYQFFVQKALGNFKGLARLQACIAREIGVPVGPLVCHATLAILEEGTGEADTLRWARGALGKLVTECEAILAEQKASGAAA